VGSPGADGSFAVAWNPRVFESSRTQRPTLRQGEDRFEFCAAWLTDRDPLFRFHTVPLVAVSCALSGFSAPLAAQQAQRLGELAYSGGGMGVIAGEIPFLPPGDEEPDWEAMPAYRRMALCKPRESVDAPWVGDDQVGRVLAAGEISDVAGRVADLVEAQRPVLRGPTVNSPHGLRVDQIHVTSALAFAVEACWRVETQVSSHRGLVASLDLNRLGVSALYHL